jgi:hypothetical protein
MRRELVELAKQLEAAGVKDSDAVVVLNNNLTVPRGQEVVIRVFTRPKKHTIQGHEKNLVDARHLEG